MNFIAKTYPADARLNQIRTDDVFVEKAGAQKACEEHRFVALWDTGANETGITKKVAEMLQLTPVDKQVHRTAGDPIEVNRYYANLFFTEHFCFQDVLVHDLKGDGKGFDVLIGMDIISQGDFSISNFEGKTTFSFRVPSQGVTDYYAEAVKDKTE